MAQAIRDDIIEELLQGYATPQDLLGEEGLFKSAMTERSRSRCRATAREASNRKLSPSARPASTVLTIASSAFTPAGCRSVRSRPIYRNCTGSRFRPT